LKFKYIVLLLLQVIYCNSTKAQNNYSDSVLKIIKNTQDPNTKFQQLCDLSFTLRGADSTKAYAYGYEALQLAKQSNSLKNQAIAYEYLSSITRYHENIKKQVTYVDSCAALAELSNDDEALAYANFALGYKYDAIGDNEKYVSHMLASIGYFEKAKKRYDKVVNGYENLAANFGYQKNITLQKKYTDLALQVAIESKDSLNIANAFTTWAEFLKDTAAEMDDSPQKDALLDSAEKFYLKAIHIFENNLDKPNIGFSYSRTNNNLSSLYVYHFLKKRPEQTIAYLQKSESVALKINDPYLLMVIYGQWAQYSITTKNIKGIEYALGKVHYYINQQSDVDPYYNVALYKNHMDLCELKNDFAEYRKYFVLHDEAVGEMMGRQSAEREYNATVRFETEKKNTEIKFLKSSINTRKKINYLLTGLSILALVAMLFIFRSYRFRKKAFEKEKILLEKEKQEAALQSKLKEEEAMNAIMEKELAEQDRLVAIQEKLLTETQKEKMQQELMSNRLQLDRKNELLKELKEKIPYLKSGNLVEIKQLAKNLDKDAEQDDEFEILSSSFQNTNPKFFSSLQVKASHTLSKLDLKYCAYMKMGMSNKEIANFMNIEAKSMRMARYRIKQKLDLDKEQDLDEFITNS
jgi:DNA-binding CsgD family transcriptional regulator